MTSRRDQRRQHWLGGLTQTSLTSDPTQRFTADLALGFEEYHSNQHPNSDTRLLTLPTSTRGKRVITTMLLDTLPDQLSHF
jgi:hypothetical protein